jgi:peptidoglycan/xylan/chitin deacetylase (PgdA/CDA1 family)
MLAVLKEEGVSEAYGFINAGRAEKDAKNLNQVFKLWRDAGYPIGNHTYDHPDLSKTSVKEFEKQIQQNEPTLQAFAGHTDYKMFRYPFLREGDTLAKRNAIRRYLSKNGYKIAQVTIDFEDWSWNNPYQRCMDKNDKKSVEWLKQTYLQNAVDELDIEVKLAQFLFKREIPHIILLHIGAFDTEMLRELIKAYKAKGVEFISLKKALSDEIYKIDPAYTSTHGIEFLWQIMKSKGLSTKDAGIEPYQGYPEKQLQTICR